MSDAVALALATGFLGGFGHCVGMCGPLVGSLALAGVPRGPGLEGLRRTLPGQLAYHAGRITTYAALGAALGLGGSFVNVAGRLAGVSQVVAVLAGVLMILLGLGAAGLSGPLRRLEARAAARVVTFVHDVVGGGPGRLYPAGLALGFLPCGLSWTVLLGAAGTGRMTEGLLVALAFGVGTLPALLVAGAAASWLGARGRGLLYRLGGVLLVAMGALFLLRGLRG